MDGDGKPTCHQIGAAQPEVTIIQSTANINILEFGMNINTLGHTQFHRNRDGGEAFVPFDGQEKDNMDVDLNYILSLMSDLPLHKVEENATGTQEIPISKPGEHGRRDENPCRFSRQPGPHR